MCSCGLRRLRAGLAAGAIVVLTSGRVAAQAPVVSKETDPAPPEIAAPVRALLGADRHRVQIGPSRLDIWWVKALAMHPAGSGGATWSEVEEGSVVGAIRVEGKVADTRGHALAPGVYTLRFAWQPQNGDHLGVSPFREFLVVSAAPGDADPKPLGYEAAVELSKKASGKDHPAVLGLDPPETTGAIHSLQRNGEFELTSVVFEVPAVRGARPAGALRFGLVVAGLIEA